MEIEFNCSFAANTDDNYEAAKYPWLMLFAFLAMASLQAQAQELFSNQSTNPSAAQFRNVRTVGDVVCGEVNKPNQQGGYDGFQRFVFRSQADWAVERGAHYRFAENGKQMDTKFMFEAASLEEKWDIAKAAQLLQDANAATARIEQLFKTCS